MLHFWSFSSFMVEYWGLKTSYSNIIRYIFQVAKKGYAFSTKKNPCPQKTAWKALATKSKSYLFYLHYSLNILAFCNEDNTLKYNWTLGFNVNCVAYTEVYTKWFMNYILITLLDKIKSKGKKNSLSISSANMNTSVEV